MGADNLLWFLGLWITLINSIAILVVLCVLLFGGMAFAKFMERREAKRSGGD